jgi:hypothetical protein
MEGLSSLLVVQKLGQHGKLLAYEGESNQFVLLIGASVAYVTSAWWIALVSLLMRSYYIIVTKKNSHTLR